MKFSYNLKPWILLLLAMGLFSAQAVAQNRTITGTITSAEDGEALIGVNVLVKGTSTGTITDFDGKYSIEVPEKSTLNFSYVGYATQEVEVGMQSVIDVVLAKGELLDEIVVTALGISREKKALGYAVSEVGADEIAKSGSNNVIGALQGKVPGVQIQGSSGAPGAGSSIFIRGFSSLDPSRSNRPLFVIDGIEVSDDVDVTPTLPGTANYGVASGNNTQSSVANRMMDINPNDIESISILRGGAAAALYGVRAANGAVIITTKSGASGAPKIDVGYGMTWNNVNRTPKVQTEFIDGHRSTSLRRYSNGLGDYYYWDNWGSPVTDQTENLPSNIYDDFYETGVSNEVSASVTAGNDVFSYRVGAGYNTNKGIVPYSFYNNANFSLNTKYTVSDKLKLGANFIYTNSESNMPSEGRKSIANVLAYTANTVDVTSYGTPYEYGRNFSAGIVDHALFLAENISNQVKVNRYLTSFNAKYNITKGLNLKYSLGIDSYSDFRDRDVHPETDEGGSAVNAAPNGFTVENAINFISYTSNLAATYTQNLNQDINLSAMAGFYIYGNTKKRITTTGSRFLLENFFNLNNALEITQSNSLARYRNMAIYGELSASYKNFLYLTVTGRNDFTSTLPTANRSYFFPSTSLSWVLSDMTDLGSVVSFAKLRASYSIVGKDADIYQVGRYYQRSNSGVSYNDDILEYTVSTKIGDEGLRPEFSKELEIGAEMRLFSNRVGLNLAYYNTELEDMILSVPISNATGASRYLTNAGSMVNNGFEIDGYVDILKSNDGLNWTTGFNWFTNEGRATKINLGEENPEISVMSLRGVVSKYTLDGLVGDLYANPFLRNDEGRLIIDDSGFPSMNWDTLVPMGNALPDWVASWTNEISYKGFSLAFMWEWKKGGDVIDITRNYSIGNGQLEETLGRNQQVVFDGVTESGEENTTPVEVTALSFYRNGNRYRFAPEVYLQDASWIRLRNISLSFDLPTKWVESTAFTGARLTLNANNIYLNTPFRGWDPESNYFGPNSNIYGYLGMRTPQTKSYGFKLNLSF